jgi:hypothetical protein
MFEPLFVRFLLPDEFDESVDTPFVAAVHSIDFVHDNDDFPRFSVHHINDILFGDVVRGDRVNEGFVANVAGVVFDDIVIHGFENIHDELGFTTSGGAIYVYSLFEIAVFAFFFERFQYFAYLGRDVLSFENRIHIDGFLFLIYMNFYLDVN